MVYFLLELKNRNKLLWLMGWLSLLGASICGVLWMFTHNQVAGINAWIKPMKFFISTTAFAWTMGWFMHYLNYKRSVVIYSWVLVLALAFELVVIVWQASNGRLSHFNISSPLYLQLFNAMGIAIVTLILWTIYITILFFVQKSFQISRSYLWAIRIGLIYFILFSFEGGMMAAQLSHTVGSSDGGEGLPVLNWSRSYGDLRVAHFFGMHALQILPLAGYFLFSKSLHLLLFSFLYLAFVVTVTIQALYQIPFIG